MNMMDEKIFSDKTEGMGYASCDPSAIVRVLADEEGHAQSDMPLHFTLFTDVFPGLSDEP